MKQLLKEYYASTSANRHIYLHQSVFSTKLLRWFETHVETLTEKLLISFKAKTGE